MNRPFIYRGRPVAGVFQRCTKDCPAEICMRHRWAYTIELPAGADGIRRQRTKSGFTTGKDAMEARADLAKSHRDGTLAQDDRKTLSQWLDEWLEGKTTRKEIGRSTRRGYSDNIEKYIKPKLGAKKLRDLRGLDLTRFYETIMADREKERATALARNEEIAAEEKRINDARQLAGKRRPKRLARVAVPRTLAAASVARIHACLSGALGDAVPDLVPRNVAKDAKLPQAKKRKVKPPKPEQLGGFLDAAHQERLYPLLVLAGYSGLRRGELVGLKWDDLDMATGRIVVARQISSVGYQLEEKDAKSEAGQDRVVFIDQVVREILTGWAATQLTEKAMWGEAHQDGGWMFTREDGQPLHPDRVTKVSSRLLRRHGLDATLHGLRHFWASALISSGADISAVSKAMGHASISVTSDIYGSLFDKASAEMATRAAALIPRRSTEKVAP
ncbi:tyrosine-type recombinase/integrase [Actinoplanes sp. NPDC051859]|uniref:tyrosine-type recombinase/integrase n=1 Tax=Actinoplanes sp. NPDC051859 TaxID=3363909 RepID=UPI0037A9E81B